AGPHRRPWTSLACGSLRGLPDPARMEALVSFRELPTLLGRELRGCFRERGDHALRGAVEERDAIGAQRFEARRVDLGRHERVAEGLVARAMLLVERTQVRCELRRDPRHGLGLLVAGVDAAQPPVDGVADVLLAPVEVVAMGAGGVPAVRDPAGGAHA